MTDLPAPKLPESEISALEKPLVNDLLAFYKLLEESAGRLFDKAASEGWTPEQLIMELDRLIDGDNRPELTEAR